MSLTRNIHISGTDPTNPKSAGDIVERLTDMYRSVASMHEELGRLEVYAGSIREVLHYEQSYPDKRASLVAREVVEEVRQLRSEVEQLHSRIHRTHDAVAECGVNLHAKFQWRPTR